MSLKQEIETWVQAITHYDNHEFDESLKAFDGISDTSKILFNCGVIHATLGEHDKAVECYQRAVRLDQYLAVAYFQQGVSNFLVGDFEEALANFNDTLLYLRGNTYIDYEQLGLKFKLFSCEVLFNRGLCYIYLQQKEAGMGDLSYAVKEKVTPDHDVIDDAIREQAEGYTVFSIPVGIVYRPNSAKVKNLKTKDYLGKARLIASFDSNTSTGFAGPEMKRNRAAAIDFSRDDRPLENISFAASNLVRSDIRSRTRQQSEPPINRNMFPPTPPPDYNQPLRPTLTSTQTSPRTNSGQMSGRADSVRSPPNRPARLDLSKQSPATKPTLNKELPRVGATRTASEPGGPRRNYPSSHSDRSPPRRSRGRLFMETTPLRRRDDADDADVDEYPDELYDLYGLHRRSKDSALPPPSHRTGSRTRLRSRSRPRPGSIDEVDEDAPPHSGSSLDGQFDLLNRPPSHSRRHRTHTHTHTRSGHAYAAPPRSRSRGGTRTARSHSRRPAAESRSIRVKVHHGDDDTRYMIIAAAMGWEEFVGRVRDKFGIVRPFKVKVRDEEGDLITLGDRDDWDMAVGMVGRTGGGLEDGGERGDAREDEVELELKVGKMEVWVHEVV